MMCACGGRTVPDSARLARTVLRWERCGCCGRCDGFALYIDRAIVATGQLARLTFRDAEESVHRSAS